MSEIIENYALAVQTGHIRDIADTFSQNIQLMPPGANQPTESIEKTSLLLGAVAMAVTDFKLVRIYASQDQWYAVLFDGSIEGTPVQFIDMVHLGDNNKIDHVDIFLRPAVTAQTLFAKVNEAMGKISNH